MPYVLTCDSCEAKLRTPTAPAVGKKVACPKCGSAFTVDDENCQEVPTPKPAAPAWEVVEDEPAPTPKSAAKSKPAPRARDEEEDEDDEPAVPRKKAAAKARRRDDDGYDDDEDDRPRRTGKRAKPAGGSGALIALLVGGGFLLLLALGVGGYFVFRDGSNRDGGSGGANGNESRLNTRAQRPLPRQMFIYWPNSEYTVTFTDYTVPGVEPMSPRSELESVRLRPDQVAQMYSYSESRDRIAVFVLKAPADLTAVAQEEKWKELKIENKTVFYTGSFRQVAFQPQPTMIVFVNYSDAEPNTQSLKNLLSRSPDTTQPPEGLWAVLQEVSGYETVSARMPRPGEEFVPVNAKYRVDGHATTETHRELLTCWEYPNADIAKKAESGFKSIDARIGGSTTHEVRYEVVGARLYRFTRSEKTPTK